jgi:hypothetical protein
MYIAKSLIYRCSFILFDSVLGSRPVSETWEVWLSAALHRNDFYGPDVAKQPGDD